MKIGITGATSGLGLRLLELLSIKNVQIKVLIRRTSNIDNIKDNNISLFYGDITDINSLNDFVKDIDICIHLAAQVGYASKKQYMNINLYGTKNLCEAIIENNPTCRLIHCSTISVLKVNPFFKFLSSNYGISKYYAEKIVLNYAKKYNLKTTIIYPGLIYGKYDKSFLPQIIGAIRNNSIKIIEGGEKNVPLIFVDELCDLFINSVFNNKSIGKRYVSVKGLDIGMHEVIKIIANKLNCPINQKTYPKFPFFILALFVEFFYKLFKKGKKPFITRTIVNNLSINFKDYKKQFDDPKVDLDWSQNTTRDYFIKNIENIII